MVSEGGVRLNWLGIVLAVFVSACAVDADPARVAQADLAYRQIAGGQTDALMAQTVPGSFDPVVATQQLAGLRAMVPAGPIPEPQPVFWSSTVSTAGPSYIVIQDYTYPGHVAKFSTAMADPGTGWGVAEVHLQVATNEELAPVQAIVSGKPMPQLILLALGAVVLGLCVVTPVVAIWRQRWWWALFSAVGVGSFQVNWFTGGFAYGLFNIQLLGMGLTKGGSAFDPWVLTLSFPLGAVLFWAMGRWKRKQIRGARTDRRPGEFA